LSHANGKSYRLKSHRQGSQTPRVQTEVPGTEMDMYEVLCSRLEAAASRNKLRFLVAIYMTALRVALEEWLEQEAQGDLLSLLKEYLDSVSLLSQ
jgi:DNA-binding transcriptional regulator YbjK